MGTPTAWFPGRQQPVCPRERPLNGPGAAKPAARAQPASAGFPNDRPVVDDRGTKRAAYFDNFHKSALRQFCERCGGGPRVRLRYRSAGGHGTNPFDAIGSHSEECEQRRQRRPCSVATVKRRQGVSRCWRIREGGSEWSPLSDERTEGGGSVTLSRRTAVSCLLTYSDSRTERGATAARRWG